VGQTLAGRGMMDGEGRGEGDKAGDDTGFGVVAGVVVGLGQVGVGPLLDGLGGD
jgi:hypothetical protein